jgi:DNA-directed RNA polymerase II subunit RPB1
MTNNGNIIAINRHGINRLDTDPLSKASFETTVDLLLNAAMFNETDHMRSVSSRIMGGLTIKGGTCLCELIMDNNMLENSELNP